MSSSDQKMINQWIANGMPKGNPDDMPAPKQFAEGWQIGTPDFVLPIDVRPFNVPATGVMPYKHFVVDPGFTEDKWIKAAECRAGNRAVVHHIIVGIDGRPLAPNSLHAFSAISSVMRTKAPTDTLTLQVDRDGTVIDVVVTLGAH
ncbi:MAG: hypothetical protein COB53_13485 [Elusimicrobia bacterium]|nr:MAG: hypothetical protein COB53_13485 [Elusimicrobiota bacterium]